MDRFAPVDFATLPSLPRTALTFEQYYAAYMADLTTRLNAVGIPYNVSSLETDTYAITGEAFSYRTALVAQSIDDAISAVLLPTSYGAYLDNLGATQDPPVARKVIAPAVGTTPAVMEKDDPYRERIALAPNALSTCGPKGAYAFFAISVPGCVAAAVYGPMSFGGTPTNPFVPPGQVRIPILASPAVSALDGGPGDGTAPAALVASVEAALSADDRRPIADFVTASAATVLPYAISAVLPVRRGVDQSKVLLAAFARVRAAADFVKRPGGQALAQNLYAALKVPGSDGRPVVGDIDLVGWSDVNAAAPVPGAITPAFVAPYCPPAAGDPVITAVDDDTTQLVAGGITLQVVIGGS